MPKSNIGETPSKIDFYEFNSVEESVKSDVEFLMTDPFCEGKLRDRVGL